MTTTEDRKQWREWLKYFRRDLNQLSGDLTRHQARYLVDTYYQLQDFRITSQSRTREQMDDSEPFDVQDWINTSFQDMESEMQRFLGLWASEQRVGRWLQSIKGIGPVMSAGFLAHTDIERHHRVGNLWSYAGLVPGQKKEKGKKLNWNAQLKVLCWKAGESFVKVSGYEDALYGQLWKQRKAREVEANDNLAYEEQARHKLETTKIGKDTDAYKWYSAGKLPPAHVHARAKRWAVKLFLSHLWEVLYEDHYGTEAPKPYAHAALGHSSYIAPPNWPCD